MIEITTDGNIDFCRNDERVLESIFLPDAHVRILRLQRLSWSFVVLVAPKNHLFGFEFPKSSYLNGWIEYLADDAENKGIGKLFAADMKDLGFSTRDLPDRLSHYTDLAAGTAQRPFVSGDFSLCDYVFMPVTCPTSIEDEVSSKMVSIWERHCDLVIPCSEQASIAAGNRWIHLYDDCSSEGARILGMRAIWEAPGKNKDGIARCFCY